MYVSTNGEAVNIVAIYILSVCPFRNTITPLLCKRDRERENKLSHGEMLKQNVEAKC